MKGQINDDWTYTGRMQNDRDITAQSGSGEDGFDLNWAFVEGKIGGLKATLGRQNFALNTKLVLDCEFDAAKFVYGKDVKVTAFGGKASNADDIKGASDDRFYAVDVNTKVAGIPVYATYYKADVNDKEIYNIGLTLPVAKKLNLKAEWMHGDSEDKDYKNGDSNGYVASLVYAGAKASAPGSYGVWATYYDQPANAYIKSTLNTQMKYLQEWQEDGDGYEGFEIGANYALAKNIVAAVRYFDIEQREGKESEEILWSEVVFTF